MPKALSSHAITALVVQRIIQAGANLPSALTNVMDQHACKKRAVVQAYSYEVIRHWQQLEFLVQRYLQKPLKEKDADIYCLMLLGCYLLYDDSTPDHAAINETVQASLELKKNWAKGLLNAILRNIQRNKAADEALLQTDRQARYNHPNWLIDRIQASWPDEADTIFEANLTQAPMTLRVNQQHITREAYLKRLQEKKITAEKCQHSPVGIRLAQACDVSELPGFAQGLVSVQDEAAQHAAQLLNPQAGEVILDACAAPGGKTLHLLEHCAGLAQLDAVDSDGERLLRINENLNRLGFSDSADQTEQPTVNLHSADAAQFAREPARKEAYDAILLDAPCSATGVIRRHPDIKLLRRDSDISNLNQQQSQLLSALWPCLKPGGRLLYCTCSILSEENQQQIAGFLARQKDASISNFDVIWGHAVSPGGRQILPGEDAQDGFYYCLLQKHTE